MASTPRDIYVPAESWKVMVDVVAPKPRGMDPFFVKAMLQFERYAMTIGGDIGDSIRLCQDHLARFLSNAQEAVTAEAGENPARLGRPRPFPYGEENLTYQVFNYKGADTVSIREDRMATFLNFYDRFRETMRFMDQKVEEGDLGIFQNSFIFIHKPLEQAADAFDHAMERMPLHVSTRIGLEPDPRFVHVMGTEPSAVNPGCICRVLKPGFVYEGREIQEGVVMVSQKPEELASPPADEPANEPLEISE
ncbi:MAG: hypothetical protein ACE15F_18265 [bacterium]